MSRFAMFLLVLALAYPAVASDAQQEQRYQSLIEDLRCLVCQNQSIAESNAPLAQDLRNQVRRQIAEGRSDRQIAEFLTDRYGDYVLYRPPFKARTWLLWLGPFVVLAGAIAAAAWFVRRSRGARADEPAPGPAGPASPDAGTTTPRLSLAHYAAAGTILLLFSSAWYAIAGSWRTQALIELERIDPEAAQSVARKQRIERLRAEVVRNPDDAETWSWLARARSMEGEYAEAAQAYAQANQLSGSRNPDWLVEEGETLAALHGRTFTGPAQERFLAALEVAPDHPRALLSAGLAALQAGDEAAATRHWARLLNQQDLPPDLRGALENRVAEMRERNGSAKPPPGPDIGNVRLTLRIEIDDGLREAVGEGATLLVYALESDGPRMPLAVQRLPADRLPVTVTLDDSNAMLPGRKLSAFSRWTVLARISESGGAQPQPGDLQGELELTAAQAGKPHTVLINKRL